MLVVLFHGVAIVPICLTKAVARTGVLLYGNCACVREFPFCHPPHSSLVLQVLVYHDMLGMLQHPHHAQFVPRFCKKYASVGDEVR